MNLGQFIRKLEKIRDASPGNESLRVFCAEEEIDQADTQFWDGIFTWETNDPELPIEAEEVVVIW